MSVYAKLLEKANYEIDLGVEGVPALRARVLSIDQLMARGAIAPDVMVAVLGGMPSVETVDPKVYEKRVDAAFRAALLDFHDGPGECPENGLTLAHLAAFRVTVYTAILNRAGLAPEVKQAASFRPDERNGTAGDVDSSQTWNVGREGSDTDGGRVGD